MEIGTYSLSDVQPGTDDTVPGRLDDIVSYGIRTERAGLDVFGLGEHHTPDFAVSSPAVVLAAIAANTRRLRLSTTATVLSVLDPVRVYQDFATLDLLSHGRAEIVAGRSAFTEPFALFGESLDDYDALFAEKLDLLNRLRASDSVTWSGRFRPALTDATIIPRTRTDLPIWVGVGGTPASAERAGRYGFGMMLGLIGGTIDRVRPLIDIYRAAGASAGHPPDALRVGITSHFYVAESAKDAVAEMYPYYHRYLSPKVPGGRGFRVDPDSTRALAARRGALVVGDPGQVIEKILDLKAVLGVDRFLGQVDFGGMPRDQVESSIDLLGTVVAPAVRHIVGD